MKTVLYLLVCPKCELHFIPHSHLHPHPWCTPVQRLPGSDWSESSLSALWVPEEGRVTGLDAAVAPFSVKPAT